VPEPLADLDDIKLRGDQRARMGVPQAVNRHAQQAERLACPALRGREVARMPG
jgi:hypothetical protein